MAEAARGSTAHLRRSSPRDRAACARSSRVKGTALSSRSIAAQRRGCVRVGPATGTARADPGTDRCDNTGEVQLRDEGNDFGARGSTEPHGCATWPTAARPCSPGATEEIVADHLPVPSPLSPSAGQATSCATYADLRGSFNPCAIPDLHRAEFPPLRLPPIMCCSHRDFRFS